ncbi:MAG: hypothetical protein HOE11_00855 [Candidatus Diapherotrites archaeon]|nr:hypothetical protein [Candidatus Diapherotrites archaeon]MBT4596598.1 hypothetical protein [Candidatus Diapherotrites archaeon]
MRKFVGKVPAERALQKPEKLIGQYRQVRSMKEPELVVPDELLDKLEHRARVKGKKPTIHEASSQRVLRILELLGSQRYGAVNGREVVAALAFEYGLECKKLLPYVNALNNATQFLKKEGRSNVSTAVVHILSAVKHDVPSKILKKMESGKVYTTHELANELECKRVQANEALLLLEHMGLAVKLPQRSKGFGGQNYLWVIESKKFSAKTLPQENIAFRIFMELARGPKGAIYFSKSSLPRGGKTTGFANSPTVTKAMNLLMDAGLVTRSKKAQKVTYALNEKGQRLAAKQEKSSYLVPKLRQALLGQSKRFAGQFEKLPAHRRRKVDLIQSFIEINMEFRERRKRGFKYGERKAFVAELANRYGKTIDFVNHAITPRSWTPWRSLSDRMIAETYAPILDQRSRKVGFFLREQMRKERNLVIAPAVGSTRIPLIDKATKAFLKRNELSPAKYNQMLKLVSGKFETRPSSFVTISDYLAKFGTIKHNDAFLVAQFVYHRWDELF